MPSIPSPPWLQWLQATQVGNRSHSTIQVRLTSLLVQPWPSQPSQPLLLWPWFRPHPTMAVVIGSLPTVASWLSQANVLGHGKR